MRFSAEFFIIRAENTPVTARAGHAYAVVFPRHGYKITNRYNFIARFINSSERYNALAVIVV